MSANYRYCYFYFVLLIALQSGCGGALKEKVSGEGKSKESEMIELDLLIENQSMSLGLLSASTVDFVVQVNNCSSGYSTTVTSTTADPVSTVSLYSYDTDCVAELEQFDWAGETWNRAGGGLLSTGSAIFVDSGTNEMNVTVYTQLTSPLTDGGTATFVFQELLLGNDFVVTDYSFSETIEVIGLEAPNVSVNHVDLTAIESGTGIATFTLSIECNVAVSGAGNHICVTPEGIDQNMQNYEVAIIYDDPIAYDGTLTFSQAVDIIDDHGFAVTGGHLDPNLGANGGFSTPLVRMDTGPLYTHRELLILVSYESNEFPGARSFRYFRAEIGTP